MNKHTKTFLLFSLLIGNLNINQAFSFGGGRTNPGPVPSTQAFPVRTLSIGDIYKTHFKLPDGRNEVDMQEALPILMATTFVDTTDKIRVSASTDPLRYKINGGVTSYVAEIANMGITFGYKPSTGDVGKGSLQGGEGALNVRIGELQMDFHIVDTHDNSIIVAKFASAKDLGATLTAKIDFGQIQNGAQFVYNSPMTTVFRKVMRLAMEKIIADPKTNFLIDWTGYVNSVDTSKQVVGLDFGLRQGVQNQNIFTVYDSNTRIGELSIQKVDLDSSEGKVLNDPQGVLLEKIRISDPVKIYYQSIP